VLELASAAIVDRVVPAARFDARGACPLDPFQLAAAELPLAGDACHDAVAGHGSGHEHDEPVVARDAVAAGRNGLDVERE
jgi:hypothetical protein